MIERGLLAVLIALTLLIVLPPISGAWARMSTTVQCAVSRTVLCIYWDPSPAHGPGSRE